ncbi:MAG: hypothetical protein PVJ76_18485, partial [Gemmatimonadota bacterium]
MAHCPEMASFGDPTSPGEEAVENRDDGGDGDGSYDEADPGKGRNCGEDPAGHGDQERGGRDEAS